MPLIDLNGLGHFKDKENAMVANDYSASSTYAVGDYVFYNGTLFRCKTAITTAEAWTAGHWEAAVLTDAVSELNTNFVNRNQWSIPSFDIHKGITAAMVSRADSFVIRLNITGGQTITCYAGITSDVNDRRTLAFNSSGTRLDYYNGFKQRSINLPTNTAYILMTADWDERDNVYIKDSNGNYLFKYDRSIEYQSRHSYKTLRVAEWNVGTWNSEYNWVDGAAVKTTHTGEELKALLKTTFTDLNADIITLCEYLDSYDGVNIYPDVLKHFYPYYYTFGVNNNVARVAVFSRFPLFFISNYTANGAVANYISGYIMVDTETHIGFSAIHLSASSAAERITQINAVANMYSSYDMALFCGDMNTGNNGESSEDIESQLAPFISNGYEPSNRGYWGEVPTYYQPRIGVDNIFVKGAVINNFTAFEDRPGSDHNPIVSEITFFA